MNTNIETLLKEIESNSKRDSKQIIDFCAAIVDAPEMKMQTKLSDLSNDISTRGKTTKKVGSIADRLYKKYLVEMGSLESPTIYISYYKIRENIDNIASKNTVISCINFFLSHDIIKSNTTGKQGINGYVLNVELINQFCEYSSTDRTLQGTVEEIKRTLQGTVSVPCEVRSSSETVPCKVSLYKEDTIKEEEKKLINSTSFSEKIQIQKQGLTKRILKLLGRKKITNLIGDLDLDVDGAISEFVECWFEEMNRDFLGAKFQDNGIKKTFNIWIDNRKRYTPRKKFDLSEFEKILKEICKVTLCENEEYDVKSFLIENRITIKGFEDYLKFWRKESRQISKNIYSLIDKKQLDEYKNRIKGLSEVRA